MGAPQYFLWGAVVDAGLNSSGRVGLDFYRAYDAGRTAEPPARFFDSWRRALELLPDELVVRCRDMAAPGLFYRPTDTCAPATALSRHPDGLHDHTPTCARGAR
jgi:hypothetical protein